jgi:hypothetical protein
MTTVSWAPALAAAVFVLVAVAAVTGADAASRLSWRWPALASFLFAAFSLETVVTEGPFGFWAEHTRNLWGNQIWFDLLLASGTAWCFIVAKAKAAGMRLWPWLVLVLCTGSVGITAMVARLLYLQQHAPAPAMFDVSRQSSRPS